MKAWTGRRIRGDPVIRPRLVSRLQGSITVDGVSLTINKVEGTTATDTLVTINLMPHGRGDERLEHLKAQSYVIFEIDTIARYIEHMMSLRNDEDSLF